MLTVHSGVVSQKVETRDLPKELASAGLAEALFMLMPR